MCLMACLYPDVLQTSLFSECLYDLEVHTPSLAGPSCTWGLVYCLLFLSLSLPEDKIQFIDCFSSMKHSVYKVYNVT